MAEGAGERKLLKETLQANKERYLSLLKELIAADSQVLGHGILGGRERNAQLLLEKRLREMGADEILRESVREEVIEEGIRRHGEGNPGHDYTDRYNLHGTFLPSSPDATNASILFNSHSDTMPPGDVSLWRFDPHTPTEDEGRLYGLGSADMKSGLMASLMAVALLQDAKIPLPCRVEYAFVCDEEGGGNGSLAAVLQGRRADGVVVCEPTDGTVICAHMGFVFFRVEFAGRANHSGKKEAGVSAIDKAVAAIHALERLEEDWQRRYCHPLLPKPNLNVGTIHGGSAGSTVAAHAAIEVCIHYLPGQMDYDGVEKEFYETLEKLCASDPWLKEHPPVITMYQRGGGFEQDMKEAFPRAFVESFRNSMEREPVLAGSPAGCDSRLWKNIAGLPVVQYGPGELACCHAVDESVRIKEYFDAIYFYANLILDWGGKEKGGVE